MSQNHGRTEHKAGLPVHVEGRHESFMLKLQNRTARSLTHATLHARKPRPRAWTPKRNKCTCSHFYRVCGALCRCSPIPVHYEYYQIPTLPWCIRSADDKLPILECSNTSAAVWGVTLKWCWILNSSYCPGWRGGVHILQPLNAFKNLRCAEGGGIYKFVGRYGATRPGFGGL